MHILVSASRAEFAWIVHMPGKPLFKASRRSRHSSPRTSPTMIRDGRIRSDSLTRSRSRTSPVPSRPACRVCIETQSGIGSLISKTSSQLITRSLPGIEPDNAFSIVVLPAWVPPETRMLRPQATDASSTAAACGVSEPSATRSVSRVARTVNLRMLIAA